MCYSRIEINVTRKPFSHIHYNTICWLRCTQYMFSKQLYFKTFKKRAFFIHNTRCVKVGILSIHIQHLREQKKKKRMNERYQLEHQCGLDNIKTHTPQIVINKWVVIFKSFQCYFYTQSNRIIISSVRVLSQQLGTRSKMPILVLLYERLLLTAKYHLEC